VLLLRRILIKTKERFRLISPRLKFSKKGRRAH
jgi:hypothetical protein